jgi:hypothetical protein
MALRTTASIVVRSRSALMVAVALAVAGATAGCARSRQSYRPIFTSPATVSTPCKNCGTGATVTTDEPSMPPVTSMPSSEPSMYDSPGASTTTTSPSGSGKTRSSTVEPQAKSRLGGEPGFDETGANQPNSTTPPPPPKPMGAGPAVQGPTTSLSQPAWDADVTMADQARSESGARA